MAELVISGNADPEVKLLVLDGWTRLLSGEGSGEFGTAVKPHIKLVSIDLDKREDATGKMRASGTIVHEAVVTKAFTNVLGYMHGGCTAFLLDTCTSLAVLLIRPKTVSVSVTLTVNYHTPAQEGDQLRIISKSIVTSNRLVTLGCEIWETTRGVLIASGSQTKMYETRLNWAKL